VALNSVVWTGSQFCAVGSADFPDAYIVTSPDGVTWTEQVNPKNATLNGVCWTGKLLLAVGNAIALESTYITTSPNGADWTFYSSLKNAQLNAVCWNGTQFSFVGVADATDALIYRFFIARRPIPSLATQ
jgi:hypothetical protein